MVHRTSTRCGCARGSKGGWHLCQQNLSGRFLTGEPQNSNECDRDCGNLEYGGCCFLAVAALKLPGSQKSRYSPDRWILQVVFHRRDLNGSNSAGFVQRFLDLMLSACLVVWPGDNYHPENSHVLPALLRRFHEAKQNGDSV